MSQADDLRLIEGEVQTCQQCALANTRKNAVPGEGPPDAKIMLIGEGPGYHENEQGRPFVGAAGKFLEELLANIGLKRADVYITNVVKCRPPGNRDPESGEIEACQTYLDRQIRAINPRVIVTLGRFSMARWFAGAKIS
ncbi:MAG: uracil-DNA glycosylase family protein, partial [Anaerolineales bacterium]